MEDNNQVNVTDNNQPTENVQEPVQQAVEEVQDPRLIHPIIIGELRKEKVGKPVMVIELFLLFGIVFAALPFINSMMTDENSFIYKLMHPGATPTGTVSSNTNTDTKEKFLDGTKSNPVSTDEKIKFKTLIVEKISLSDGQLKCTMHTSTGILNLDDYQYYIELTSSSEQVLAAIKLVGSVDIVEKEMVFEVFGFQYNSSMAYKATFKEMGVNDYPETNLPSVDERGNSSLVCVKGGRTLTYNFSDGWITAIYDEDKVSTSSLSSDEYINSLKAAQDKSAALGAGVAGVEEVENGYVFTANINITKDYKFPTTVHDNNYYSNTKVSRVVYEQKGKGFDCR